MKDQVFKVTRLSKSYGESEILSNVNFELNRGDRRALIGLNGSGKSTFINSILGVEDSRFSQILLFKESLSKKGLSRVGYLPEEPSLLTDYTVKDYIKLICNLYKVRTEKFEDLLIYFKLKSSYSKIINELSKGQRQILSFIQAFFHDPSLIILDEPIANLDPEIIFLVRDFLNNLSKDKTLLISSHRLDELSRVCDSFSFLHNKKIEFISSEPQSILTVSFNKLKGETSREMISQKVMKNLEGVEELKWSLKGIEEIMKLKFKEMK